MLTQASVPTCRQSNLSTLARAFAPNPTKVSLKVRMRVRPDAAQFVRRYFELSSTKFRWISVTTSTGSRLSSVGLYFQ